MHAANISRRGRLGPLVDISRGSERAWLGDVAADAGGNLIVAWQSSGPGGDANAIVARRLGADGSLGPIHVLVTGRWASDVNYAPRMALDRAGNATVAWFSESTGPPDSFSTTIEACRVDLDGNLSPLTDVSAPFSDVASFQITVDPAGNQTLAWVRHPGPLGSWRYIIELRTIGRDGVLGPIETLASGDCPACPDLYAPKLVSDADGVVTAVWLEPQPNRRAAIKLSRFVPG
jgi:hypothetical protein